MKARLGVLLLALSFTWICCGSPDEKDRSRGRAAAGEVGIRGLLDSGHYAEASTLATETRGQLRSQGLAGTEEEARILDLLLEALWRAGRGAEPGSQELGRAAVSLKETLFGPDSPETAVSLILQATLFSVANDLSAAEAVLQRALRICQSKLAPGDIRLAMVLRDLGFLAFRKDSFESAREYFGRALAIFEGLPTPDELEIANISNALATLDYEILGDYTKARAGWERALSIRERLLGGAHPLCAGPNNNLGLLYEAQGDERAARIHFDRAIEIRVKALGPNHPLLASPLNNRAWLQTKAGELDSARTSYERARDILVAAYGEKNLDVADVLHSLGALHHAQHRVNEATAYYTTAMSIARELSGDTSWRIARGLYDLASLSYQTGELDSARARAERCLRIRQATLGPEHPLVGATLTLLAAILAEAKNPDLALGLALEAETIGRNHMALTARALPEREALLYSQARVGGLGVALYVLDERDRREPESVSMVWDALIRSRALVMDEMEARVHAVRETGDAQIARLDSILAARRLQLARLVVRGAEDDVAEKYAERLAEARRLKEEAERDLAHESAAFRESLVRARPGLQEVREHLPGNSALVAYAVYQPPAREQASPLALDRPAHPTWLAGSWDSDLPARLVAFVLGPGASEPVVVSLGPLAEVGQLVSRWSEAASRPPRDVTRTSTTSRGAYHVHGAALRKAIWDPVATSVGDAPMVFVIPDAELNRVSFAALPLDSGEYLAEAGPGFHYLASERDLLLGGSTDATGSGFLGMGGVDFDTESKFGCGSASRNAGSEDARAGSRSEPCALLGSIDFLPLPGTEREIAIVADLWKKHRKTPAVQSQQGARSQQGITLCVGREASERTFRKKAPGKRVLHVATHGFFLGQECLQIDASAGPRAIRPKPRWRPAAAVHTDALLLCGLAFAGANRRDAAASGEDDGILMGEEIAALDFRGTGLAVLSACDTGVGEVRTGEGVLGLRRAFQIAGLETLVMSLWPVSDEATSEWMENFYAGLLSRDLSAFEALQYANLETLRVRRGRGDSDHPFYWAGFVSTGRWK